MAVRDSNLYTLCTHVHVQDDVLYFRPPVPELECHYHKLQKLQDVTKHDKLMQMTTSLEAVKHFTV